MVMIYNVSIKGRMSEIKQEYLCVNSGFHVKRLGGIGELIQGLGIRSVPKHADGSMSVTIGSRLLKNRTSN